MAVSDSTQLNDLIGTIVSADAQSAAYAARVMRPLVRSTQIPQGAASIVVPRFAKLTPALLSEGTAPGSTTWTTDGVTLTPVERGVYVQIAKHALYADPFSDLAPYGEQLGRSLANDEDYSILALASGTALTTNVQAGSLTSADSKNYLLSGIAQLEAANAPGPYFGVFHPTTWQKLRASIGDAAVMSTVGAGVVNGYNGMANLNGYVGSPYGIPCFISTNVSRSATVNFNILASKEAFGYAFMQDIGVDVMDNVVARAFDLMAWYCAKGSILVEPYAAVIKDTF